MGFDGNPLDVNKTNADGTSRLSVPIKKGGFVQ